MFKEAKHNSFVISGISGSIWEEVYFPRVSIRQEPCRVFQKPIDEISIGQEEVPTDTLLEGRMIYMIVKV